MDGEIKLNYLVRSFIFSTVLLEMADTRLGNRHV